jgi:hypothetical protein
MTAVPTGDNPRLAAEEPEHRRDRYQPIRPGETDHLRTAQAYLSQACRRGRHWIVAEGPPRRSPGSFSYPKRCFVQQEKVEPLEPRGLDLCLPVGLLQQRWAAKNTGP